MENQLLKTYQNLLKDKKIQPTQAKSMMEAELILRKEEKAGPEMIEEVNQVLTYLKKIS